MNDPNLNSELPASSEGIAETYVETQLVRSRLHLKFTRIFVVVSVVGLGIYMVYLTSGFRENLHPETAAEITATLVGQRMDDAEPQFASFIREKVPDTIRRAPDYALERLPEFRENIEKRVEDDLRGNAQSTAVQLDKDLGEFLTMHKPEIEAMIQEPDKATAANAMGAALETRLRDFLAHQEIAGATIKSRVDNTLKALDEVEKRTSRLALNKGLTLTEKKTRHAVAILMRQIDSAKVANPLAGIAPALKTGESGQ